MNSRVRISRWKAISSSTSRLASGRLSESRKLRLVMCAPSGCGQGSSDGAGILLPALLLRAQVRPAVRRQRVVLRLSSGLGLAPLLGEQALALEPGQAAVERAFLYAQHVGGRLANPAADGVSVARAPRDRPPDEKLERAGVEIGPSHGVTSV